MKFKVVRGGQEKGTGGKHQNENKEGKTHKATDVMRCSKGDLRVKIIQEQVEGVVKRGLKGKTKHEAYGGCVSCSLLTSTKENKEEEKKKLMELEFAGANVAESCKKKLKQGMKVQFSLGREPTTRKYVVVDIAPIEGGGVEEKKTKKKEGDDKTTTKMKKSKKKKKTSISKRFQHPTDASINSRNRSGLFRKRTAECLRTTTATGEKNKVYSFITRL